MIKDTLSLINLGRTCDIFHDDVILFTWAAPQVNR